MPPGHAVKEQSECHVECGRWLASCLISWNLENRADLDRAMLVLNLSTLLDYYANPLPSRSLRAGCRAYCRITFRGKQAALRPALRERNREKRADCVRTLVNLWKLVRCARDGGTVFIRGAKLGGAK